jgi:glutaconyl-CoA decarboxylase
MPGKILRVAVQTGATVEEGDLLLVLEAMKMENEINAPVGGTVQELKARDGDSVNSGDVLAVIG